MAKKPKGSKPMKYESRSRAQMTKSPPWGAKPKAYYPNGDSVARPDKIRKTARTSGIVLESGP
ncbi:MAG: hypothetical protein OXC42_09005, partial [Gammaproteobacteria bacterium]|nr:hypothetical protein [Gammaproteobacteria bacterium]